MGNYIILTASQAEQVRGIYDGYQIEPVPHPSDIDLYILPVEVNDHPAFASAQSKLRTRQIGLIDPAEFTAYHYSKEVLAEVEEAADNEAKRQLAVKARAALEAEGATEEEIKSILQAKWVD